MEFKVGAIVLLHESNYQGLVGAVIAKNKSGILVRFNGTQQLYFNEDELQAYEK